jgi:predicted RNase H-like HicB family nuclease
MVTEIEMQAIALIHEEDGAFGVSFPDFPGATTVARTADEAVAKAGEVLAFHVEGLAEDGDVPTPRSLSQLREDPQFKEDADGAVIAYVPYLPPSKVVRVNMTFDEGLLARVDRAASALGETRSGFFATAARARMIGERAPTTDFQQQIAPAPRPTKEKARGRSR